MKYGGPHHTARQPKRKREAVAIAVIDATGRNSDTWPVYKCKPVNERFLIIMLLFGV